jgi:hypothetical protein
MIQTRRSKRIYAVNVTYPYQWWVAFDALFQKMLVLTSLNPMSDPAGVPLWSFDSECLVQFQTLTFWTACKLVLLDNFKDYCRLKNLFDSRKATALILTAHKSERMHSWRARRGSKLSENGRKMNLSHLYIYSPRITNSQRLDILTFIYQLTGHVFKPTKKPTSMYSICGINKIITKRTRAIWL